MLLHLIRYNRIWRKFISNINPNPENRFLKPTDAGPRLATRSRQWPTCGLAGQDGEESVEKASKTMYVHIPQKCLSKKPALTRQINWKSKTKKNLSCRRVEMRKYEGTRWPGFVGSFENNSSPLRDKKWKKKIRKFAEQVTYLDAVFLLSQQDESLREELRIRTLSANYILSCWGLFTQWWPSRLAGSTGPTSTRARQRGAETNLAPLRIHAVKRWEEVVVTGNDNRDAATLSGFGIIADFEFQEIFSRLIQAGNGKICLFFTYKLCF